MQYLMILACLVVFAAPASAQVQGANPEFLANALNAAVGQCTRLMNSDVVTIAQLTQQLDDANKRIKALEDAAKKPEEKK